MIQSSQKPSKPTLSPTQFWRAPLLRALVLGSPFLALMAAAPPTSLHAASGPATSTNADIPEKVTYAGEIAAVLNENCASCHRAGDIAPMSLRTYDEARPWAKGILRAVENGDMPPWHADPEHGTFKNDRRLSEREVALIKRWVSQGAPAGDLNEAPTAPELNDEWRLGTPDLIVTFDSVKLPAGGPDMFRDLVAKTGLKEDKWVRAIEVLPQDRRVVHHVIIYATDGEGPPTSGWLGAWAAGMEPMTFPKGTAKLLDKDHRLIADMHYHPSGEKTKDATRLGVYFYDGEPEKELINLWVQNGSFKIPAGDANYEVKASHTFAEDAVVHALLPHMHYRGKDFTYIATLPDGSQQTLLEVSGYDFNWQTNYELANPVALPKGSRIDCVAHFDNSTNNPDNPDPTLDVTFGNESFDEMMIGFVDYVVADGQRPITSEARMSDLREALLSAGTEAYEIQIKDDDGGISSLLDWSSPEAGIWHVPVNGTVIDGSLEEIVRAGDGVTAKLVTPIGTMDVEGQLDSEGFHGKLTLGPQILEFTGTRLQ